MGLQKDVRAGCRSPRRNYIFDKVILFGTGFPLHCTKLMLEKHFLSQSGSLHQGWDSGRECVNLNPLLIIMVFRLLSITVIRLSRIIILSTTIIITRMFALPVLAISVVQTMADTIVLFLVMGQLVCMALVIIFALKFPCHCRLC